MSRHWPDKLGRRHRHRWRRCLLRRRLLVLWRRLHTGCSSGRSRLRSEGPPRHRRQTLWRRNRKAGAGGHRSACGLRHSRFFRLRPSRVGIDCCAKGKASAAQTRDSLGARAERCRPGRSERGTTAAAPGRAGVGQAHLHPLQPHQPSPQQRGRGRPPTSEAPQRKRRACRGDSAARGLFSQAGGRGEICLKKAQQRWREAWALRCRRGVASDGTAGAAKLAQVRKDSTQSDSVHPVVVVLLQRRPARQRRSCCACSHAPRGHRAGARRLRVCKA